MVKLLTYDSALCEKALGVGSLGLRTVQVLSHLISFFSLSWLRLQFGFVINSGLFVKVLKQTFQISHFPIQSL